MAVSETDLYDLLDVLHRMGARVGGSTVMIQLAKDLLTNWTDEHFWEVAEEAEKRGLLELRRGGYVVPTLDGARLTEKPRPEPN